MRAEQFEERLLAELKDYVNERAGQSMARPKGRRARAEREPRSPWRLAGGGLSVAAAIALAVVLTDGGSPAGASSGLRATGRPLAPAPATSGPLYHVEDAGFAIDAEPSGVVDITILEGTEKPDVNAIRNDLAKAGIPAEVVQVPTCAQLESSPGAPSPVGSAEAVAVNDPKDRFLFDSAGDVVYQVDAAAAATRGTTVWVVVASTLSTLMTERLADSSPRPNCL